MAQPLSERRAKLKELLLGSSIRFSAAIRGAAEQVVKAVAEYRLEGVVAKRIDSPYKPGDRSAAWVKLVLNPDRDRWTLFQERA